MKYAYLGESEIQVSKICIGCMGFGEVTPGFHVWVIDQRQQKQLLSGHWIWASTFLTLPIPIPKAPANNFWTNPSKTSASGARMW